MLSNEGDNLSAIVQINAGAGEQRVVTGLKCL